MPSMGRSYNIERTSGEKLSEEDAQKLKEDKIPVETITSTDGDKITHQEINDDNVFFGAKKSSEEWSKYYDRKNAVFEKEELIDVTSKQQRFWEKEFAEIEMKKSQSDEIDWNKEYAERAKGFHSRFDDIDYERIKKEFESRQRDRYENKWSARWWDIPEESTSVYNPKESTSVYNPNESVTNWGEDWKKDVKKKTDESFKQWSERQASKKSSVVTGKIPFDNKTATTSDWDPVSTTNPINFETYKTLNQTNLDLTKRELDRTREVLKRTNESASENKKQMHHFANLYDKSEKENKILKKKLELLEKNPNEYYKRKSLDPFNEENWED